MDEVEFTLKVRMSKRWVPHFLSMLKYMEYLGNVGSTRTVSLVSDGYGDFRPKFETDYIFNEASPVIDKIGNRTYDAGL